MCCPLLRPIDRARRTLFVRHGKGARDCAYIHAGTGKPGSCHLLRHTAATGMLEGGADIRYVAELLGHARLETTQIYTRVSIDKLTEVHARTHPSARQT